MFIYLFILIALIFFSTNKNNKISAHVCLFFLMGLISLKGDVGPDYTGYLHRYNAFNPLFSFLHCKGEIGWFLIEYITYTQKWDYQTYTIFTGVIGVGFLIFAHRKIQHIGFLVFIFQIIIIQLGLSGMRQFIAVCILTYASSLYIFENNSQKGIKYIYLVLLASSFHISASVMLCLLPFFVKTNKKIIFLMVFVVSLFMYFNIISDNIEKFDTRYLQSIKVSSGAWIRFLFTSIITFFGLTKNNKKLYHLGLFLLVFGTAIGFVNSVALHRFNYYLISISSMILIRNYQLGLIKPLNIKLVYIISIFYLIFYFVFSTHGYAYIPYSTFF